MGVSRKSSPQSREAMVVLRGHVATKPSDQATTGSPVSSSTTVGWASLGGRPRPGRGRRSRRRRGSRRPTPRSARGARSPRGGRPRARRTRTDPLRPGNVERVFGEEQRRIRRVGIGAARPSGDQRVARHTAQLGVQTCHDFLTACPRRPGPRGSRRAGDRLRLGGRRRDTESIGHSEATQRRRRRGPRNPCRRC